MESCSPQSLQNELAGSLGTDWLDRCTVDAAAPAPPAFVRAPPQATPGNRLSSSPPVPDAPNRLGGRGEVGVHCAEATASSLAAYAASEPLLPVPVPPGNMPVAPNLRPNST